jgi:hypothetical protein
VTAEDRRSPLFPRLNLALLVAVLAAALVPAAFARPVVSESPSEACSTPTLTGPTQARVGETYTVRGCGFAPGRLVPLELTEGGGCCQALNTYADANGNVSYSGYVWGAGQYRVRALVKRRDTGRWRVGASWSFQATG